MTENKPPNEGLRYLSIAGSLCMILMTTSLGMVLWSERASAEVNNGTILAFGMVNTFLTALATYFFTKGNKGDEGS